MVLTRPVSTYILFGFGMGLTKIVSPAEFSKYNWGFDVVRRTVELVREVDGEFELPKGFFTGDPYTPSPPVNGQK
jgi:hypothetical protein